MEYGLIIIGAIILLGIVGIWFSYRFLKRKRRQAAEEKNVPQEILDDLDKAEEKMKGGLNEDGTTISPHKILWEIAREKGNYGVKRTDKDTVEPEQAGSVGELHEQPIGRQDIQTRTTPGINKDKPIARRIKPNNIGRVIARARARSS